jgi:ABC-type nitrate/sulfonate/bicarbonate transport system substrate-binding protein
VVSALFLEKHPDTVITFLRSWLDGVEFCAQSRRCVSRTACTASGYTTLTPAIVGRYLC